MDRVFKKLKQRNVVRVGIFITAVWLIFQASQDAGLRAADQAGGKQFMRDGVLVSLESPALAIDVDDSFTYVGRHSFTIRDVAAGERYVFVDATGDVIERLFLVQIEGFLRGIDDMYRYNLGGSPVVAGYPFRSNGYAFDLNVARANNPGGESAVTAAYLEARGYSVPDQWMMWRSLTVADETRKSEIIFFYVEDIAGAGLTLDDLYQDDTDTEVWTQIQKDLKARASAAFRLTGLNEDGQPNAAGWTRIPD